MTQPELTAWLQAKTAAILLVEPDDVDPSASFASQGLDSMSLLELTGDLSAVLNQDLPTSLVWEYPSIVALATQLAGRTPAEQEAPILPVDRNQTLKLTFSQERTWHHFRTLGPDPRQYISGRLALHGPVDTRLLDQCLVEIVRRHEVLRTTFPEYQGEPVQLVHPPPPTVLKVIDLSTEADAPKAAWSDAVKMKAEIQDLSSGPLVGFILYRIGPEDFRLGLHLNHILADLRSMEVLLSELAALYGAGGHVSAARLPDLPIQVADFAIWQREHLKENNPAYQKQVPWWLHYHHPGGASPPPAAPAFARATPQPEADAAGSVLVHHASSSIRKQLKTLASRHGATLSMVTLTACFAVLEKHGGTTGLLLGHYVSDRRRGAVLPLIGYFINLVVLRTQSVSGRSFPAALETVRDLMMQVTSHQDLPFDMLCQAFNKAGLMPPYPAMAFQHLDSVPGLPVFPGLTATEWKDDVKKPMMPWGLSMETAEVNDQLRIRFSFDKRLYDPEAVAAMHLACCRLLEEAASLVES